MSATNYTPTQRHERWAPILGFPGYEISNTGKVRSHWERGIKKGHKGFESVLAKETHLMKPRLDKSGYWTVGLRIGPKQFWRKIHNLMLRTFVGAPPGEGHIARHLDDDRNNNVLANLAWGTHQDNINDRGKNGHTVCGERCHKAKITSGQAREIYRRVTAGECVKSLAIEFGIRLQNVHRIRNRKSWAQATASEAGA